jgi:hypothetical protein
MRGISVKVLSVTVILGLALCGCGSREEAAPTKMPETKKQAESVIEKAPVPEKPKSAVMQPEKTVSADVLMIADFNAGEKPNNIGGNFGAWDKDPGDLTQSCRETFDMATKVGDKGFSMRLDYDVDSPNPAYNGFWMFLQNIDATPYNQIAFDVKGDKDKGFTQVFKVELKNPNEVGRYYATGVTDEWTTVKIPIRDFRGISDISDLTEFVIVFEDRIASNKEGILYLDNIRLLKE